jgi:hypothetical protein
MRQSTAWRTGPADASHVFEAGKYVGYPPRSQEHRGLQTLRGWLLEEAREYCRQIPALRRDDTSVA